MIIVPHGSKLVSLSHSSSRSNITYSIINNYSNSFECSTSPIHYNINEANSVTFSPQTQVTPTVAANTDHGPKSKPHSRIPHFNHNFPINRVQTIPTAAHFPYTRPRSTPAKL